MAWTNLSTRVANVDNNAAADVNALMADLLLIKGGVAGTAPTVTLEELRWKTYQTDVAYTNGTPAVTMTATTPAKSYGYLLPYQTSDGQWWMRGCLGYTHDSVASNVITISGVVCGGAGSLFAISCYYGHFNLQGASNPTSNFEINITFEASYGGSYVSFDVPITAKPTWAD